MSRFVLMVCGPHLYDDRPSPIHQRIDAATYHAAVKDATLLVCGDACGGEDVRHFIARARGRHPDLSIHGCYDPGACTLTDVRAGLRQLNELVAPGGEAHVLLVTDDYHIRRAGVMLRGEIASHLTRGQRLTVEDRFLHGTPRPPDETQLAREEQGLRDYLDGRYRARTDNHWGKPSLVSSVPSPSPSVTTSPSS